MSPLFKCFNCGQNIERSTKTFWKKKGHILCSSSQDKIEQEISLSQRKNLNRLETFQNPI